MTANRLHGAEIKALRLAYGLTIPQMADLIGASTSTVYRWEAASKTLTVDPLQTRLLGVMKHLLESDRADEVVRDIAAAITTRGGLFGLYRLLGALFRVDETTSSLQP